MDVSSFLGGRFLTHLDLSAPTQVWTVRTVTLEQIQTDRKICIQFAEHQKPLGLNKINLRTVVEAFGVQAQGWIGQRIELRKDRCLMQGREVDCVRLRVPPQAAYQQPIAQPQPGPVAQPQPGAVQVYPQPQPAWQPTAQPAAVQPIHQQPVAAQQPAAGQQAGPATPPWGPAP